MTEYDCTSCGACCMREWRIEVSAKERKKLGDLRVHGTPGFYSMRHRPLGTGKGEHGGCVCLKSSKKGMRHTCSIYEDRPKTCRDFEPGCQQCIESRELMGIT